jgi:DNA-binding NarL/FixJ family response regulator
MRQLVRVLIADDHAVVRKGLRSLLTQKYGIEVIGEAANGIDAVALACKLRPAVILMDLVMPGATGLEAIRTIINDNPESRIVILTSFAEESRVKAAIQAGAIGYVSKDAPPDELIEAIHAACLGSVIFPHDLHHPLHTLDHLA